MIGFVTGNVVSVKENEILIDVSGVGYRVTAPTTLTAEVKAGDAGVTIYTSLIFSDNLINLFGFATEDDREIFELLITVSGVGPKAAIRMLSLPRDRLIDAISAEDSRLITTVPGIGPKTAKRVILELKDKVGKLYGAGIGGAAAVPVGDEGGETGAAVQGLQSLGYSVTEIRKMIDSLDTETLKAKNASEIIRLCLQARK